MKKITLLFMVLILGFFLGTENVFSDTKTFAVKDFVTRFYTLCLDREPDSAGLNGWVSALLDGTQTGSGVANGFVFSQEFINKNTTHEEYLTVLYEAFFNRQPDQGGWDGWLAELNRGTSRADVLNGFIYAQEFNNLCWEYGISPNPVDAFVTRFYRLCLDREPDEAGLNGWVSALLDGTLTGSDVANGFVFSQEFINKNTTNEEYLTVLYQAFFNRQPDQGGWDGWLSELNRGTNREDVLNGFIFATEFFQLCDEYGILPYDPLKRDDDGDGFTESAGDCNDSDQKIHPAANEICGDGIDQDCNGSDLQCSGGCISVSQGIWQFEWSYQGPAIIEFSDGFLSQTGCHVSYDFDNIFSGPLTGNHWQGTNTIEGFQFEGNFSGNPADRFSGTVRTLDGSDITLKMTGFRER